MNKFQDVTGKRFERLTVIKMSHRANYVTYWLCKCDCGNTTTVNISKLNSGNTRSCGCLHRDILIKKNYKHGKRKSPEYVVWCNMKSRCNNPKRKDYKNYGGRGIKVCDKWLTSFSAFFDDMGEIPFDKATIDRIDNDKGYSPENCKWATAKEQQNNKRNNRVVVIDGVSKKLQEWIEIYDIHPSTLYNRKSRGMGLADALKKPVEHKFGRKQY